MDWALVLTSSCLQVLQFSIHPIHLLRTPVRFCRHSENCNGIQGHGLQSEFQESKDYAEKLCLEKSERKRKENCPGQERQLVADHHYPWRFGLSLALESALEGLSLGEAAVGDHVQFLTTPPTKKRAGRKEYKLNVFYCQFGVSNL